LAKKSPLPRRCRSGRREARVADPTSLASLFLPGVVLVIASAIGTGPGTSSSFFSTSPPSRQL